MTTTTIEKRTRPVQNELNSFKRLLDLYPTGILSVVSDTWDLWKVCTEYLPALKDKILTRDGKLVIRPDSGDPVDIICGINSRIRETDSDDAPIISYTKEEVSHPSFKGVIELLWDVFGGTTNEQGYKVLDSHIGAIYGDSITLDRAKQICERLKAKGFASTNIVLGIGSFTYQYNTRDTFGFAMKATYGEITTKRLDVASELNNYQPEEIIEVEAREIFKDPITDDGTKRSKKGLLNVVDNDPGDGGDFKLIVQDQLTWEQEKTGLLTTVFKDGQLVKRTTLEEIRQRLRNQ